MQEEEGYIQNGGEANLAERVFNEMFKEYKDFLGINQLKGKRYENIVQKIGGMK